MELNIWGVVVLFVLFGGAVWWVWQEKLKSAKAGHEAGSDVASSLKAKAEAEVEPEVKKAVDTKKAEREHPPIQSRSALEKLTKAKIAEYAAENGITLNVKKTKAEMITELQSAWKEKSQ